MKSLALAAPLSDAPHVEDEDLSQCLREQMRCVGELGTYAEGSSEWFLVRRGLEDWLHEEVLMRVGGNHPEQLNLFAQFAEHPATYPQRERLLSSMRKTFDGVLTIVEKKNGDYGADSDAFRNFRSAEILGVGVEKAILVRTLDKLARINNLLEHSANVKEESLEDTLVDAIGYLAILKAYREMGK